MYNELNPNVVYFFNGIIPTAVTGAALVKYGATINGYATPFADIIIDTLAVTSYTLTIKVGVILLNTRLLHFTNIGFAVKPSTSLFAYSL